MYTKQSNKNLNKTMELLKQKLSPEDLEWLLSKKRKKIYEIAGNWLIDLGEKSSFTKHATRSLEEI